MKNEPVLIDIAALSEEGSDAALEVLAKAFNGEDGDGPDIWAQHESPFVRSLIELFSQRGLMRLDRVRMELEAWLSGRRLRAEHKPSGVRPRIDRLGWTPDDVALVKIYLENLPAAAFHADDWSLLVDYIVHRYLPAADLQGEAEWLAVRSTLMGKVQAAVAAGITVHQADVVMGAMPLTVEDAWGTFKFSDAIKRIMEYGRARCADQVTQLTEQTRHRIKRVILSHQEQVLNGVTPVEGALQTQLFDEFAALNRDWRRIAVTEVGENANNGLLASLEPGTRVKRMEQYRGACAYCKKINGRELIVVPASKPLKNGELEVWVGKNNIGRSAASRRRVGSLLVERQSHERYWIPAGTVHPHCRGVWHVLDPVKPGDDPEFAAFLALHLSRTGT